MWDGYRPPGRRQPGGTKSVRQMFQRAGAGAGGPGFGSDSDGVPASELRLLDSCALLVCHPLAQAIV